MSHDEAGSEAEARRRWGVEGERARRREQQSLGVRCDVHSASEPQLVGREGGCVVGVGGRW